MNTIVLYGPGEVAKRRFLIDQKKSFPSDGVTLLDGKQSPLNQLKTSLSSNSLFTASRLIILENAADDLDLVELQVQDPDLTLIVVGQSPSATKTILKSAIQIKAKLYSFDGEREVSAFPFLDALITKNPSVLVELDNLLKGYGEMYTLTMIYYLWRRNILPPPSSAFAAKKIAQQKRDYSLSDFSQFYTWTLDAELKIKSGILPGQLALRSLVQKIISC